MDNFIALNDTAVIEQLRTLQSYINSTAGINA